MKLFFITVVYVVEHLHWPILILRKHHWLVVEAPHWKIWVKLEIFPKFWGENKQSLKPPLRSGWITTTISPCNLHLPNQTTCCDGFSLLFTTIICPLFPSTYTSVKKLMLSPVACKYVWTVWKILAFWTPEIRPSYIYAWPWLLEKSKAKYSPEIGYRKQPYFKQNTFSKPSYLCENFGGVFPPKNDSSVIYRGRKEQKVNIPYPDGPCRDHLPTFPLESSHVSPNVIK